MAAGLEIHDAASTGDFDSLEEYLRSGKFDVNLKDAEWGNRTALHWACAKGTHNHNETLIQTKIMSNISIHT